MLHITNPFLSDKGRKNWSVKGKKSVWQMIKSHNINLSLPTIFLIDGKSLLRKDWDNQIHTGIVSFVSLPLGGGKKGGSNPLSVVLMVALVVLTVYTGGTVGAAGVSLGGSMLISEF